MNDIKSILPPDFISQEEIEQAKRITAEVARLVANRASVNPFDVIEAYKAAHAAHMADPSDANFELLKQRFFEMDFWRKHLQIRAAVKEAQDSYARAEATPWSVNILQRAIKLAAARLADITRIERERHLELTGEPLQSSSIIAAAEKPLAQLKHLREEASAAAPGSFPMWSPEGLCKLFGCSLGTQEQPNKAALRSRN